MGYIIASVILVVALGFLIVALLRGGSEKPPRGVLASDQPVIREEPSADAPTPARSSTATTPQAEQARRHTPPA